VEPFLKMLEQSGCSVTVFDPLVSQENIRRITGAPIGKDILSAVEGADLIACMATHKGFLSTPLKTLKAKTSRKCWFFDGRHGFDPAAVGEAGFLYTGIGLRCHSDEPNSFR
jgi:UDP-N-acetyl-D-mannosaminuronic acid dehydrogenase